MVETVDWKQSINKIKKIYMFIMRFELPSSHLGQLKKYRRLLKAKVKYKKKLHSEETANRKEPYNFFKYTD